MRTTLISILVAIGIPASALADDAKKSPVAMLEVTSSAFANGQAIPADHSCEGPELSPPLTWSTVPTGTKSIAILVDDPDAPKGTFTHWIVTGIPPTETSLGEGAAFPDGAVPGKNDKGTTAYVGMCPPTGRHHYYFKVYALDRKIAKPYSRSAFLAAIKGHVLAKGELMGTYQKQALR